MFHFNVLVVSWKGKIVTRKALHPRNDCRHWIVPAGSFLHSWPPRKNLLLHFISRMIAAHRSASNRGHGKPLCLQRKLWWWMRNAVYPASPAWMKELTYTSKVTGSKSSVWHQAEKMVNFRARGGSSFCHSVYDTLWEDKRLLSSSHTCRAHNSCRGYHIVDTISRYHIERSSRLKGIGHGLLSAAGITPTPMVGSSRGGLLESACDVVPWLAWVPAVAEWLGGKHRAEGWAIRGPGNPCSL